MSQLDAALTGVTLTLNFESQIVSREWEARLSWNDVFDRTFWKEMHCCLDLNTFIFFHVYVYKNVLRPVKWRPFKSGFYVITDILHLHK